MPQLPPVLTPFTSESARLANAKSHEAKRRNNAAKNLLKIATGKKGIAWGAKDAIVVARDTAERVARMEARLTNNGKGGRPRKDGRPTGSGPLPRHRSDNPLDDLPPPTLAKPSQP